MERPPMLYGCIVSYADYSEAANWCYNNITLGTWTIKWMVHDYSFKFANKEDHALFCLRFG